MRWSKGKGPDKVSAKIADAEDRADEAEAALRDTEKTTRKVDRQVSLAEQLRERWAKVHERNNLAELFTQEYRRTH